jgi:hypothetical protein
MPHETSEMHDKSHDSSAGLLVAWDNSRKAVGLLKAFRAINRA